MRKKATRKKCVKWPVAKLKDHPKQSLTSGPPSEEFIRELAADMARNGLHHPIEILPDGTIVGGHRRTEAAKRLGWTHIDAIVRADLANDDVAAEKYLLRDNLLRGQDGPITTARKFKRLIELEQMNPSNPRGGGEQMERQDLRDRVGKRLGISGRTLDRHVRVLDTPQEVMDAVEKKLLKVSIAEKIAGLPQECQAQIAAELRAGADPREVARAAIEATPRTEINAHRLLETVVRGLIRWNKDLPGRFHELHSFTPKQLKGLADGEQLLKDLRLRGEQVTRDRAGDEEATADDSDNAPSGDGDDDAHDDDIGAGLGRLPMKKRGRQFDPFF